MIENNPETERNHLTFLKPWVLVLTEILFSQQLNPRYFLAPKSCTLLECVIISWFFSKMS
jgi:hypothetical protein